MYIYINGDFVLQNEAKISPFDHGFLYGIGVFETFRIYEGHPFLLDDHFQRLTHSVKELNIKLKLTKEELQEIITRLLKLNFLKDAYVRFNVSAGEAPIGLQTDPYTNPTIIVFIKPINSPLEKAKKVAILTTPRNTPEGRERLKSHHYLNNIFGKRELPSADTEGVFLTKEGYVAEGVVSNIFWMKDGHVYTPSVKTGILNGITRQFIIALLKKLKITCHEGFYPLNDLVAADEVFITNSIQEVVSVTMVNDQQYIRAKDLTLSLQNLYEGYVNQRLLTIRDLDERA